MISSEIKELLNNSDRIITMYKGTIIEEFIASQVSEGTSGIDFRDFQSRIEKVSFKRGLLCPIGLSKMKILVLQKKMIPEQKRREQRDLSQFLKNRF